MGDQPWDRTTFSRASAERYDHTSSLVALVEPTAGVEPAPARYEGAVHPATLRRRGPAGWSRTSLVPLKRRAHGRSATTGYDEMKVGCRAGIRTRIFPVNSRTCCRCHHPTSGNEWSGREDSNLHAPAPEAGGLPITLRPEVLSWGERPESNRLERVSQTRGAPFAFAHRRIGSR